MVKTYSLSKSLIANILISVMVVLILAYPNYIVQAADFPVNTAAALNNAIKQANNEIDNPGADTITLSANIILTGTLSAITSEITLNGNGYTLDGDSSYRVLDVSSTGNLTINHLTISNGLATNGGGGGILNLGTLTVNSSTLTNNSAITASPYGGGVSNVNGTVTVNNCTFSDNNASVGGGIRSSGELSTLIINNSTFSSNSATFGGGVSNVNGGSLSITSSTFSSNSATYGGGVRNDDIMNLSQTIIANSLSGGDCSNTGTIATNSLNLIEDNSCSPAFSGDPSLDTLADNGGPTQTHALFSSSIAIDKVPTGGIDQRGAAKEFDGDGLGDTGNEGDIGAFELREMINVGDCAGSALDGSQTIFFTSGYSVTINLDSLDGINCISVEEMGTNHPMATGPGTSDYALQTGNWWHIAGNINSGFNVDITLYYDGANDASRVCQWPGNLGGYGWDCGNDSDNHLEPNHGNITRTNITSFSDWAVGDHVGPTAISLFALNTQTSQPLVIIATLVLVSICFGGVIALTKINSKKK